MNPNDSRPTDPQQQLVERLKAGVNVLVTVSNNPSVDQLSAAIGFTLILNKLGKHATAVFSGQIPSTMEFLKPEATLEKNTDSLRDFIVSLDKSKADKLRYKVEENVVKIFITPYRTSITEKDLEFTQGDFNVDVVVALGVTEREHLDQAIVAHGRILHDATVVTVSAGSNTSNLGAINWQNPSASSLCEMLVGICDQLQPNLLDAQASTAFLTGIVAETERFRNSKTTPQLMTMAASLMGSGANQLLIASQLEKVTEVPLKPVVLPPDGAPPAKDSTSSDGSLTIEHAAGTITAEAPEIPIKLDEEEDARPSQIAIDEHGNLRPAVPAPTPPAEEPKNSVKPGRHMLEPRGEDAREHNESEDPHTFTSAMTDSDDGSISTDSLTDSGAHDETLSHDRTSNIGEIKKYERPVALEPAKLPDTASTPAPLPEPTADNTEITTIPPAFDDDTLRNIEKTFDSEHIAEDPNSTLNEIEEVKHSPHLNTNNARDAVQNAISAAPYDSTRPQPLQALNATSVNLGPSGGTPMVNPSAAPTTDPILAGLGLTNAVPPVLPPAPTPAQDNPAPSLDPGGQSGFTPGGLGQAPPPVPPPLLPLQ